MEKDGRAGRPVTAAEPGPRAGDRL